MYLPSVPGQHSAKLLFLGVPTLQHSVKHPPKTDLILFLLHFSLPPPYPLLILDLRPCFESSSTPPSHFSPLPPADSISYAPPPAASPLPLHSLGSEERRRGSERGSYNVWGGGSPMLVRSDEHRRIHGDEDGGDGGASGSEWCSTGRFMGMAVTPASPPSRSIARGGSSIQLPSPNRAPQLFPALSLSSLNIPSSLISAVVSTLPPMTTSGGGGEARSGDSGPGFAVWPWIR
jgi:hypothetical protein